MTVVLTGSDLEPEDLERVARAVDPVSLDDSAVRRMRAAREVVEQSLERSDEVYGLTTGVGAAKRNKVDAGDAEATARRLVRAHRVAQGPVLPHDAVRAAVLSLANGFARGGAGVRPELVSFLVDALNADRVPPVRSLGSVGQADLALLAELADQLLGEEFPLAPGEGLALLGGNAFATGASALGVVDAARLLDEMDAAAALSLEGFGANLEVVLHPAIGQARPYVGLKTSLEVMRSLLRGSHLWEPGAPRNLQDPLTFRTVAVVHGAARDALAFARDRVAVELNGVQTSPMVLPEEDRLLSMPNFEPLPLVAAIDLVRIALAPAASCASERVVKLLDEPWSGLPRGLVDGANDGLSYLGISVQSIAAEARLLAAPVSFELVSTAHAEGIEDRTTMGLLGARRLSEMVALVERVVAIELAVAAQAIELRDADTLGSGTAGILREVRARIPVMGPEQAAPPDVEKLLPGLSSRLLNRAGGR
ncbi:MAG TPA: aromatic amino acid ammonia-lyase [Actinomycetota bacterium]